MQGWLARCRGLMYTRSNNSLQSMVPRVTGECAPGPSLCVSSAASPTGSTGRTRYQWTRMAWAGNGSVRPRPAGPLHLFEGPRVSREAGIDGLDQFVGSRCQRHHHQWRRLHRRGPGDINDTIDGNAVKFHCIDT